MDRVKRGVLKILVGLVVLAGGGLLVWSGVRDVKLGMLDQMTLVRAPGCCRVCHNVEGGFCQEVCPGDDVDPRVLLSPVVVCGNKGCREMKAGDDLKCD